MTLRTTQDLPTRAEPLPAPIGHNSPPSDIEIARAKIDERLRERMTAANAWIAEYRDPATGEFKPLTDEAAAAACEDFLKQLRDEWTYIEAERVKEGKPHNDALKAIQSHYKPILGLIETAASMLKKLKASWLEYDDKRKRAAAAEAKRIADEKTAEAERLRVAALTASKNVVQATAKAEEVAREAADLRVAASDAAQAKPQIKGEISGRASGYRTTWRAEITDAKLALMHYATSGKLLATLQIIADADARSLHERLAVPGVKAISERSV